MEKLKQLVCARIDEQAQEVIALVKSIESEAELGYKEQKTAAKIASFFAKQGLPYQTGLALTGVKASIGAGDINVAILGELDAVLCADEVEFMLHGDAGQVDYLHSARFYLFFRCRAVHEGNSHICRHQLFNGPHVAYLADAGETFRAHVIFAEQVRENVSGA